MLVRGCRGGQDGGEGGTDGDRVVREAFIQDRRAEKWPAVGDVGGECSRCDCFSCVCFLCVSLTPRGNRSRAGGSSLGLS